MKIQEIINKLNGSIVANISSGDGVGSTFYLDFNDKQNISIGVFSSWRLIKDNEIITTSQDDNISNIPLGLDKLIKEKVIILELKYFNDLNITFSNNFQLNIFCDFITINGEVFDNWLFIDNDFKSYITANSNNELLINELNT